MRVTIKRVSYRKDGTFGVLLVDDLPICLTLERPWQNNAHNVSCIPHGNYTAKRIHYPPKFPNNFQVMDVPNRTGILIHRGATEADTQGCIVIGGRFEVLGQVCGVIESAQEFDEFMLRTSSVDALDLTILDVSGQFVEP